MPSSLLVRHVTGADVSHALLYIGDDQFIEATSKGVQPETASGVLLHSSLLIILRRVPLSDEQARKVVRSAVDLIGKPYDKIGAAGAGLTGKRGKAIQAGLRSGCWIKPVTCYGVHRTEEEIQRNASPAFRDDAFFCSELVARAFELARVPIVDGSPSFTHPRAIRVSPHLRYVGHLKGLAEPRKAGAAR